MKANNYYNSKNFKGAALFYKLAAENYKLIYNREKEITCRISQGKSLRRNREYENALSALDESLDIGIKYLGHNHYLIGETWYQTGLVYGRLGETNQAIHSMEQALGTWERQDEIKTIYIAKAHNNLGVYYRWNARYSRALDNYLKAIKIYDLLLDSLNPLIASAYNNVSIIFEGNGDYDKALTYVTKAIHIAKNNPGSAPASTASKYNNLGKILMAKGEEQQAFENYSKALELWKLDPENNYQNLAIVFNNLGEVYFNRKKFEKAYDYYFEAISVWKKYYNDSHPDIAEYRLNLSSVHIQNEEYEIARETVSAAMETLLQFHHPQHPLIARCYIKFAEIENSVSNHDLALDHIRKAIESNTSNGHILSDQVHLQILAYKADILMNKYNVSAKNKSYLDSAIVVYKSISELIDDLRKSYKTKGSILTLSKIASVHLQKAIDVSYLLYEGSQEPEYLENAFYFAEKNRANVLVETILEYKSEKASGVLDSLLERKDELMSELILCEQALQIERFKKDKRDMAIINELDSKAKVLNEEYETLIKTFESNYKNYYDLKYNTRVIGIKEVQHKLDNASTFVEYALTDSTIYIFVINNNESRIFKEPLDSVNKEIAEFRSILNQLHISSINEKTHNKYVNAAFSLYQRLLSPGDNKIPGDRLIIVPDGILGYIPFEALLTEDSQQSSSKDLPYVLQQYAITYANSATLQFDLLPGLKTNAKKLFYGSAPFINDPEINSGGVSSNPMNLNALPHTFNEVKTISELIGGDIYTGSEAVLSNFLENGKSYKIIHIATHGIIDDEFPMNSAIYFYPGSSSEQNKLTTTDLFNLRFDADMVVLSACNTGYGKLSKGEGIMSLARGFSYAGVPSVTMSLWSINDASTARLMNYYYEYLKKGLTKDDALRKAKLDYIDQSDRVFAYPYYWSGLIVIGKNDGISFTKQLPVSGYLLLFIPIIIGMYLLGRKRKRET